MNYRVVQMPSLSSRLMDEDESSPLGHAVGKVMPTPSGSPRRVHVRVPSSDGCSQRERRTPIDGNSR